jgi:hypothetical protein
MNETGEAIKGDNFHELDLGFLSKGFYLLNLYEAGIKVESLRMSVQ